MPVTLTLGPVVFQDFEVPEVMPFGGAQMLVVKKLVGGDRVIDAMGRDDAEKTWSGRFRGPLAETRAAALDQLRIAGQQQLLTWSSRRYLVVIERFEARFQQPFEIPYSISCTVIQDLSAPILTVPVDPNSAIVADLNAITSVVALLNIPQVTNAMGSLTAATSAVSSYNSATVAQTSAVQSGIGTAQTAVTAQQTSANSLISAAGGVAGVVGGGNPAVLAQSLSLQATAMGNLSQMNNLQALLGRTSVNVNNAGL
jgi:hypothetical protein